MVRYGQRGGGGRERETREKRERWEIEERRLFILAQCGTTAMLGGVLVPLETHSNADNMYPKIRIGQKRRKGEKD